MKKRSLITLILVLSLPAFIVSAYTWLYHTKSSCMDNCTGSPGDGWQTCAGCHGGTITYQTGLIHTDIPSAGYTAGNMYTITLNFSGQTFQSSIEITAENNTGMVAGKFLAGNNTFTNYDSSSVMSCYIQDSVFIFNWKAPVLNAPDTVIFYASFNDMFSTVLCSLSVPLKPVMVQALNKNTGTVYSDGFYIHINLSGSNIPDNLLLYNVMGKTVWDIPLPDLLTQYSIPVPHGLSPGKYFVRLGNDVYTVVILKSRQ